MKKIKNSKTGIPQAFLEKLVELYSPRRIILFGSRARGNAMPDSDFDLMVIVEDDIYKSKNNRDEIYNFMWDLGVAADVLVWTESVYLSKLSVVASLPSIVESEGREIYAA